jgi:hypothetical protein
VKGFGNGWFLFERQPEEFLLKVKNLVGKGVSPRFSYWTFFVFEPASFNCKSQASPKQNKSALFRPADRAEFLYHEKSTLLFCPFFSCAGIFRSESLIRKIRETLVYNVSFHVEF